MSLLARMAAAEAAPAPTPSGGSLMSRMDAAEASTPEASTPAAPEPEEKGFFGSALDVAGDVASVGNQFIKTVANAPLAASGWLAEATGLSPEGSTFSLDDVPVVKDVGIGKDALSDVGIGASLSGTETAHGIQDLLGMETDAEGLAQLREQYQEAGPWAGAGRIATEAGQFALPAAAAMKGAKALGLTGKALGATALGGEALGSAAIGGAKMPEEGETRGANAAEEAVYALGGGALGSVLTKALKGINLSKPAQSLIDKGVYLTPAQASEGVTAKAADLAMQVTPLLSKARQNAIDKSIESYGTQMFKEAAPTGSKDSVTGVGKEGFKQLKDAYTDAYTKAWAKAGPPDATSVDAIIEQSYKDAAEFSTDTARGITKMADDIAGLADNYSPTRLRELDNAFRKKIAAANSAANPNPELADVLGAMRQKLRSSVSPDAQEALRAVDSQYGKYVAVKEAMAQKPVMEAAGQVTPSQLMGGVSSATSKNKSARGLQEGPLQDYALEGVQTIGQKGPNPILDFMKAFAVNSYPVPMEGVGKAVMGQTAPQQASLAVVKALRDLGISGGSLGAAISE